jgi:serine/threonine protein kinase/tetratricopeptide (TPR) repeat protein
MVGQVLKHYRILEQIGAGGMGVVYRAHDEELDRDVAIKVLPPGTLADDSAGRRFRKEALSLARLNHPNVATVHEFSSDQGVDFLVTEYIPGLGLDARIAGRALPVPEIMNLGIQLAQGLAAAHQQNLVHRDLKPANIRITPDGRLKILDFGLARLSSSANDQGMTATLTKSQEITGTLPYMAPEQLRGEPTDTSSDIWSTGVVLYESATGTLPFRQSNGPLLINSILNEEPKPPRKLNSQVSPGLENVILKALAKNPAHRYQSIRELGIDLERMTMGVSPVSATRRDRLWNRTGPRRWWIASAAALPFLLATLLVFRPIRTPLAALLSSHEQKHIAVLPFDNIGNNPETGAITQGLMDSMTSKLSNLDAGDQSLWVVPASVVRQSKVDDPASALRDLGATVVVKGSIQRSGQDVHLTVNLIETKTLRQLGSAELEDRAADLAALQNEAVSRLAKMMNIAMTPEMIRNAGGSVAPAAYESYLKALGFIQRYDKPGNLDSAITALTNAVNSDPHFAVGYTALGEAYRLKFQVDHNPRWIEEALASCKRAGELDERLPGTYVTLGNIHDDTGKHDLAIQEFQRALSLNPRDPDALSGMAHAYENAGRIADAEAAYLKATALRPDYWDGYNSLALFYDRQRRFDEAISQLKHAIALTPDNAQAYFNLGAVYLDTDDPKKIPVAEAALKKSLELSPSYPAYANLGYLYLQQKRYADSAAMTEKALRFNGRDYIGWENLALAYSWLNRKDKAVAARERELTLLEEMAKLKPQDANLQASLGVLYAKKNLPEQAIPRLQSALALAPDDPEVLINVGDGYEALGQRKLAIDFLEKGIRKGFSQAALANDPDVQSLLSDPNFRPQPNK